MKRLGLLVSAALACAMLFPAFATAAYMPVVPAHMPAGELLPIWAAPGELDIKVGDTCYGAGAWAGFTRGMCQNAPEYCYFTFTVTGPDGVKVDVTPAGSGACWIRELWDPAACESVGTLTAFNSSIGAAQYMVGWFTPTFVASQPGVYQVHSSMMQTRSAIDLVQVWAPVDPDDPNSEMVALKRPIGYKAMAEPMEFDYEFTVTP